MADAQVDILIIRHVPENHAGAFTAILELLGLSYQYVEAYQPQYREISAFENLIETRKPKGIVVLGGPQHAMDDELAAERAWLKQLVDHKMPIFAICLGSQMLASVLGGEVHRNRNQEVGWVEIVPTDAGATDPVFSHFANQVNHEQFHWHNDSFTVPPNAVSLATSATCPSQAFLYGENIIAVQFHPEVAMDVIERWMLESKSIPQDQKTAITTQSVQALAPGETDNSFQTSMALFEAFCRQQFL